MAPALCGLTLGVRVQQIRRYCTSLALVCLLGLAHNVAANEVATTDSSLRIAAASAISETGLMDLLLQDFAELHPNIETTPPYTGNNHDILEQGRQGRVDLLITHHSADEGIFMTQGYGESRTLIMYNELAIFVPQNDLLKLMKENDLSKALHKIAEHQVAFMYPNKNSGISKKLESLWQQLGIEPNWEKYKSSNSSPAATLDDAAKSGNYAFADMASYLSNREAIGKRLSPLYRDDAALRAYYSVIILNPEALPQTHHAPALIFLDYLVSARGQNLIKQFGAQEFGKQIFTPAAHLDQGIRARLVSRKLAQKGLFLKLMIAVTLLMSLLGAIASWLFIHTRRLEQTRRISEERFQLAVSGSNDGIWDWDIKNDNAYFSPRLYEILDLPANQKAINDPMQLLRELIHPADREHSINKLVAYLNNGDDGLFASEYRLRNQDGGYGWVMMRGKAIRDSRGEITRMSGSVTDITDLKAMKHQAMHDVLTGLPNRTLLYGSLEQAIISATITNKTLALIIMDLDRFKIINDTLGHQVGDMVLQQVGERLLKAVNDTDTVVRLGGDEFAVALPLADEYYAKDVTHKILNALEEVFELGHHHMYVSASLGVALFPQHGADVQSLIQHADVAMYVAKRSNNGFAFYNSEQDSHSVHRLAFEKELHEAIENDVLELHYQPKVNIRSGNITGVEALLRWTHPQRGLITPDEMIPIAEQTGLIKPLTQWVLDNALSQYCQWRRHGIDLRIAVNLSVWNLQDPTLIQQITDKLSLWDVPASRLELEITESAMMADPEHAVHVMLRLHAMGIGLAIDDYGTGFSSLAYLKKFPLSLLKIDKSFVLGMVKDENDATIVRSTIELAHNLGMHVVAEGAETIEIYDILAGLGCETAQGFYLGRPKPPSALTQWLRASPWSVVITQQPSSA